MSLQTNQTPNPVPENSKPTRRFLRLLTYCGVGIVVLGAAAYALAANQTSKALSPANLRSHNIFALLGDLNGTTNQMLQNTESLHQQVLQVRGKLGELNTQDAILQKQTQTGGQLSAQLTRQEQLTGLDVNLMQQILTREQQSVTLTTQVASQAQQLGQTVGTNAEVLSQLKGPLQLAGQESDTLNGQLDTLQSELNQSANSFQLFGKLNQLLDPLHVKDTLQKIEDSVLPPAVKQGLEKLLPPLPLLPTQPTAPSTPTTPPTTPTTPSSPPAQSPLPLPIPTLPTLPLHL